MVELHHVVRDPVSVSSVDIDADIFIKGILMTYQGHKLVEITWSKRTQIPSGHLVLSLNSASFSYILLTKPWIQSAHFMRAYPEAGAAVFINASAIRGYRSLYT